MGTTRGDMERERAMAKVDGLVDLLQWRPADINTVVDGTQPCNSGDDYRRDLFHPDATTRSTRIPESDCRGCPFRVPCAHYAVHHERDGYWGGLHARERERIRAVLGIELESPSRDLFPVVEEPDTVKAARRKAYATRVARGTAPKRTPLRKSNGQMVGSRMELAS